MFDTWCLTRWFWCQVTFAPVCRSHAHASQCILHAVSHVTGFNEVELADGQGNRLPLVECKVWPSLQRVPCFAWRERTHAKFCSNNLAVFLKCAFCYYKHISLQSTFFTSITIHMYKLSTYTYPKILQIETAPIECRPTYDLVKMPNFEAAKFLRPLLPPPAPR